jgi:hypothetical protein
MYAEVRTRINEGTLELLDHEDSLRELRGLQLELLPGGSTRVGHAGYGKARDDYADAIALVVSECRNQLQAADVAMSGEELESFKYLRANYDRMYSDYEGTRRRMFW